MIANSTPKVKPGDVAEVLYRLFVERVREYSMIFLDRNGIVATWNDGAEMLKGYRPEEIIGKPFSLFYGRSEVENRRPQYMLQVATMEGRAEDEGWRYRKDGSSFWASVVITAVKDIDGTLLGFAKITRDLTERKHHEDELRQGETQYRMLIESVRDHAIVMLDAKGRVLTWNGGAKRLHGYDADEVIGRSVAMFYPEGHGLTADEAEAELKEARESGRFEKQGVRRRKDGTLWRAHVTITPIVGASGRVEGYAKVTRALGDATQTDV